MDRPGGGCLLGGQECAVQGGPRVQTFPGCQPQARSCWRLAHVPAQQGLWLPGLPVLTACHAHPISLSISRSVCGSGVPWPRDTPPWSEHSRLGARQRTAKMGWSLQALLIVQMCSGPARTPVAGGAVMRGGRPPFARAPRGGATRGAVLPGAAAHAVERQHVRPHRRLGSAGGAQPAEH